MKKTRYLAWALTLVAVAALALGCTATQKGAAIGAALGAGAGAIIGHNTNAGSGTGALIGAGAGALGGALTGDAIEKHQEKKRQTPPDDPYYP